MTKTSYGDRWIGKVDRFNRKFPPGTSVTYTAPGGAHVETSVRYPAVMLSNGRPVIWLVNVRDYVSFDKVVVL